MNSSLSEQQQPQQQKEAPGFFQEAYEDITSSFKGSPVMMGATAIAAVWVVKSLFFSKRGPGVGGREFFTGGFEPKMNAKEALQILGLRESTLTKSKLKDSHRRIMLLNHPDKGGSPFLATKINEAKDFLEKRGGLK
ncbi:uncharacterized protein SAPINGB_P003700 [Magnusiomyces paraingens]|uniref:Mitochondrial import inner membrane translocase subunit TIM14 n=1 Tax=Magnusiomyces paraingens TaxID=2606893 RepID=A0A5E8BSZ3_9ASCO|nr:uncharacterized protein SAPINGB_P003700 [Saprochaete ingens]VVT53689.1 unnamed protein product [Saprochaete ingens]